MSWNPLYGLLLFGITLMTWLSGLLIDRIGQQKERNQHSPFRKICLTVSIILTLSPLFFYKYTDFILTNLSAILSHVGISIVTPAFDIILPVGISFYTFQALGYVIDIYRGDIKPEKNIARYALFVSFFPQLLAGPIGRAKSLKAELFERRDFNYENARYGLLLMLWGYFQKMIIADHAAVLVNSVYDDFYYVPGYQIIFATLLFTVQIYCDFAAYSAIALGAARIMGIKLIDNFRQPYLAGSIQEFWRRWHISLSTWFRDYLYISLGGNRGSRARKYRNIMITFLVSGLWHGASWNFIVWGGLHGFYQIIGNFIKPLKEKYFCKTTFLMKIISILTTFFLVSFAWIFFRANGLSAALSMIRRIFTNLLTGQVNEQWVFNPILLFGIIILILVDLCREKFDLFAAILKQKAPIRWFVYYAITLIILVFGIYGTDYVQTQFIYFQF
jgi:D-alanyl-lipoteichoic acid acyltransferase DltB (MBOAT superfamily)